MILAMMAPENAISKTNHIRFVQITQEQKLPEASLPASRLYSWVLLIFGVSEMLRVFYTGDSCENPVNLVYIIMIPQYCCPPNQSFQVSPDNSSC